MQDKAFLPSVEQALQSAWPDVVWRDVHVLVAVSGGADSVALLRAVHAQKQRTQGRGVLHVAHFDHRQRGEASAADARWVQNLAETLGCPAHLGAAPTADRSNEEALRYLRHDFLVETAGRVGARWIATGHHADDQAETVLFRVLRGSGVQGLAGIAPRNPIREGLSLVRPLLGVRRTALRDYLVACGQGFREDATNDSIEPTRNWLRRELLPAAVERMGPSVPEALCRLAEHADEAQEAIAHTAQLALADADVRLQTSQRVSFKTAQVKSLPKAVCIEALRIIWRRVGWGEQAMSAAHWRTLAEWVAQGGELPQLPGGVSGEHDGQTAVLAVRSATVLP